MPNEMTVTETPEISTDVPPQPSQDPNAGLPKLTADWNADLAAMQAAVNARPSDATSQTPEAQPAAQEPAQPVTQAATAPAAPGQPAAPAPVVPEVPEKFRGPDGKLDQEKVLKSYADAQRELHRLQNERNRPQTQQPQLVTPPQPQATAPVTPYVEAPFAALVAQDMINRGIDPKVAQAMAPVIAGVSQSAYQEATLRAQSEIAELRQAHEERQQKEELRVIAARDPWVLSPQGLETLTKVRQDRPWVNASPTPWTSAYREVLADRAMQGNSSPITQVQTPTPKAPTAPSGPVGAANRALTPNVPVDISTKEKLMAHLKTLTKDQEKAFWAKAGISGWRD